MEDQKKYKKPKTILDALKFKGETLEQFNKRCEHDDAFEKSVKEIAVFANALRKGVELTNNDIWYFPWHYRSSFGFSYGGGTVTDSGATLGSNLCVFTSEDAVYMAKCLPDTFHTYLSGNIKQK